MAAKIIDGKQLAGEIREEVRAGISAMQNSRMTPRLVAVQAGENEASAVYTKQQKKSCENSGIEYELQTLPASAGEAGIIDRVKKLNSDDSVTGIILQLPLPEGVDAVAVQSEISVLKDVEGVNPANLGWITYGKPKLVPCTAAACMLLIESTGIDLYGREAVMVGHSDIVGKPAALLLVNRFATVSVCHIATGERGMLPDYVRKAEILIAAVGKPGIIKGDWVREGAVVIDVGINRVEGKITGDVEFEKSAERAGWITPVPGGVGPVTTAMLLKNTVEAAKLSAAKQ